MARREIPMNEVVETIDQWHKGMRSSTSARPWGLDRKTVRKYVESRKRWESRKAEHYPTSRSRG